MNATQLKNENSKTVRVLGIKCKVGTKKHARLLAEKKHFDDLASTEQA